MVSTRKLLGVLGFLAALALIATACSSPSPTPEATTDSADDNPYRIPQKDWPDPLDVPMEDVLGVLNDPDDPDGWGAIGQFIGEIILYELAGGFNSSAESVTVQVASFLNDSTQVFAGNCEEGHRNDDESSQGSIGGSEPAVWTTTFDPADGQGGSTRVNCGVELAPSSIGDPTAAREGGLLPTVNFNWDAHGSGGFDIDIRSGLPQAADFDKQIAARAYKDIGQGSDGVVVLLIQLGSTPNCPTEFCGISYLKPDSDQVSALTDWVFDSGPTASPQPTLSGVSVSQDWPDSIKIDQQVNGTITVTNNTTDDISGGLQLNGEVPPGLGPATISASDGASCQGSSTFTCLFRHTVAKGSSVTLTMSVTPSSAGEYEVQVQPKGPDQQYQNESTNVTVAG